MRLSSQREDGWFGPRDSADYPQRQARSLAAHGHAQRASVATTSIRGDERVLPFMTRLFQVGEHAPRRPHSARLLAETAGRRQHRKRPLALQPHRRLVAARPGEENPRQHGALGRGRGQLAQREHRPGLPRRHRVLDGIKRRRSTWLRRSAITSKVMRHVRPVSRRRIRRR